MRARGTCLMMVIALVASGCAAAVKITPASAPTQSEKATGNPTASATSATSNLETQLQRLSNLKVRGDIAEDEYTALRRRVLETTVATPERPGAEAPAPRTAATAPARLSAPRADIKWPPTGSSYVISERKTGSYGAVSRQATVRYLGEQTWQGRKAAAFSDGSVTTYVDARRRILARVKDGAPVESFEPYFIFAEWPIFVGKWWVNRYRYYDHTWGRSFDNVRFDGKVEEYQDVRTAAGTFKAFKIALGGASSNVVLWYSGDLGLVIRMRAERFSNHYLGAGVHETELVSYRAIVERVPPVETARTDQGQSPTSRVDFGRYHALVIGNQAYRHLPALKTPTADAEAIAEMLRRDYGFASVVLLKDVTRTEIIRALDEFRRTLIENDNLLIYYAGHGYLDKEVDRGYWLPVDATSDSTANWLSNADITDKVRGLRAKHVLVVADSCYAGTLVRDVVVSPLAPPALARLAQKRARTALTSGGLEPVTDVGGGAHSVFARAFIEALRGVGDVTDATSLFGVVRRQVLLHAEQTPQYSDIRQAGHDGGDFLFVRAP